MDLGLSGSSGLVAASSRGLGYALAHQLLQEGAGVAICSRSTESVAMAVDRLKASVPTARLYGYVCDVQQADSVRELVTNVVGDLGGLDFLVTNAGGPPGGDFQSIEREAWESGIRLTLLSAVNLIREALPHLRRSSRASILTITSISVKQPIEGLHLSNVIRPAVIGLTKSLSQELGPDGIRVNSILPGWTATERVEEILEYRAAQNNTDVEEERFKITSAIPMGRMGRPEEFGKVGAFLLSSAASYLTGVALQADGGSYAGLL